MPRVFLNVDVDGFVNWVTVYLRQHPQRLHFDHLEFEIGDSVPLDKTLHANGATWIVGIPGLLRNKDTDWRIPSQCHTIYGLFDFEVVSVGSSRIMVDGRGVAAVNAYMDGMFQQAVTELGNGTKDGMFQQAVTELGNGTKDGMFQQAVTELGNILDAYTEREKSALAEYLIAMELRRDLDWRKLSKIGFSKRTLNRLKNRALNDGGMVALVKQMRDDGQVKDDVEWFTAKIEKRRRPSKTAISGNQPSKTAISGNQPSKTAISGNQPSKTAISGNQSSDK